MSGPAPSHATPPPPATPNGASPPLVPGPPVFEPTPIPKPLRTWMEAVVVGTVAMLIYAVTCAPGILWGDSAIFADRVHRGDLHSPLGLALAHPFYILAARVWTHMLTGDYAWRVNLFSALCSAFTIVFAYILFVRLTGRRFAALAGVLVMGLAHTFWMHAVVAECYALYGLALSIELLLLERFARTHRRGALFALALVNGLNLSNHLLALLHLPAYGILLLIALRRRRVRIPHILATGVFWLAGAGLYLGMIAGEIAERGEPATVIREALTGRAYAGRMGATESIDWPHQFKRTALAFGLNFPTPVILLAIPGAWMLVRRTDTRAVGVFALLLALINTAFGLTYRVPDQYVFFYPTYMLLALSCAAGVAAFASTRRRRAVVVSLALLPTAVYEIAPPMLQERRIGLADVRDLPGREKYRYFLRPRRRAEHSAHNFAISAYNIVGPGDWLIAESTVQAVLVYVRNVDGVGRDVVLNTSSDLIVPPPAAPLTRANLDRYAAAGRAYVCDIHAPYLAEWIRTGYNFEQAGDIFRIVPKPATPTTENNRE
jgi:hypothetical protein